jgi:hypothetical protein
MIVLYRAGLINVSTRIALVTGLITMKEMTARVPVFDTLEQFVAHHSGGR